MTAVNAPSTGSRQMRLQLGQKGIITGFGFIVIVLLLFVQLWKFPPGTQHSQLLVQEKSIFRSNNTQGKTINWEHAQAVNNSCVWSPSSHQECVSLLGKRLPEPKSDFQRPWFFFGDSTMGRLAANTPHYTTVLDFLTNSTVLGQQCKCNYMKGVRCKRNIYFGLRAVTEWLPPANVSSRADELIIGPYGYGIDHPQCQNCQGCHPRFTMCSEPCKIRSWGGYLGVEYARDVELQTDKFRTSQENIKHFLRNNFRNRSDSPICVAQTGIHDVAHPNFTHSQYLDNVEWYLGLLQDVCSHIIWIQNTAPRANKFRQTKPLMREMRNRVAYMLSTHSTLKKKCSVVDVFEASLDFAHTDNIHMSRKWYASLGEMIMPFFGGRH